MISLVPTPFALNRTMSARQTCLCGALRSRASAFRRRRSAGLRVMEIPVRMPQTRMHPVSWESLPGFKCQTQSTSIVSAERIVFNVKGNAYRLVVAVDFEKSIVWIKWIGTHRAYDKIDVTKVR